MERFLYVFEEGARDKLLAEGFVLLKSDNKNDVYIFANKTDMNFELVDITFVRSDVLTF